MTITLSPFGSSKSLIVLSQLLLPPDAPLPHNAAGPDLVFSEINREELEDVLALAKAHHVVVRGLENLLQIMRRRGDDSRAEWAATALATEGARIKNAMSFLQTICAAFQTEGYDITVIKSLDHWPDLGSDLDLYTNANPTDVLQLMSRMFEAQVAARSWGDRLARKWNFVIAGLPEAVEIHMGRLGQTGEQEGIATSLARRARLRAVGNHMFKVPCAEDRLMISVLQRMYRHFYFRLCDIVETGTLLKADTLDYESLRFSSKVAGIWKGVASYLVVISDYLNHYRGKGLDLPPFVRASARFGGDQLHFSRGFLRIPIMPQSATLYGSQLTTLLLNRELRNSVRLSLLPCLATAAAVGHKITGSDKGVW